MRNRCTNPLSKAKVRQSWSKYNLYNLARISNSSYRTRNFFQQKWTGKSMCRAYHGEQVREGQWERMFSRRLRSVIPMNPEYMARNDGRLESAGRGSGQELSRPKRPNAKIPYMQMTFAPLERRLDSAIFRALFASSARQARQFVVHGAVRVNGKKMIYPGYLLNPGDMFQVNPERVMFATGATKAPPEEKSETGEDEAEDTAKESGLEAAPEEVEETREPREILRDLLSQAKTILSASRDTIGAKRKQDLRAFSHSIKRTLSKSKSTTVLTDSLEAQWLELQHQLKIQRDTQDRNAARLASDKSNTTSPPAPSPSSTEIPSPSTSPEDEEPNSLSTSDYNSLHEALTQMTENPIDDSKPYATPWMPRDYMSAFAFIPRYLEVHPAICAAVYIRHPVARPGMSEVPTPFSESTTGAAFAWYLRRR